MAVDRGSAQSRAAHDGAEVVEVKDGAFLSFFSLFHPRVSRTPDYFISISFIQKQIDL